MQLEDKNNFSLKGKTILILSPQVWSSFKVSKHHYAIELAKKGNIVYFVNPPHRKIDFRINIHQVDEIDNIKVIEYSMLLPYLFRFHLLPLFKINILLQIKRIVNRLPKIDVVWDFDNSNLYHNLDFFGAPTKIFHPVDKGIKSGKNKSADIIFSASSKILNLHSELDVPKFFINHGLSHDFKNLAEELIKKPLEEAEENGRAKVRIGYVGNLSHPAIDKKTLEVIISRSKDCEFHFFGPYSSQDKDLNSETIKFISFLKAAPNVILYGITTSTKIIEQSRHIDIYLACYKKTQSYDSDNSHKILEYLATGKVVVSNFLSMYKNCPHLLMPDNYSNKNLPEIFRYAVENIAHYNDKNKRKERIGFALKHTYSKQIDRIECAMRNMELSEDRIVPDEVLMKK